jgi:phosphate-selective porin OprO and OprP
MRRKLLISMCSLCMCGLPFAAYAGTLEELLIQKGVISRSEAAQVTSGTPAKVYWKNGTKVDFPDSGTTFGINTFIQSRYEFHDVDKGQNTSSFSVNKARLIVSGTALNKEFEYYLQSEFAGSNASLKDAYLKWNGPENVSARFGQYKTQVSRQFTSSDYALQFADRSVASDYFDLDRNQGVEAMWGTETAKIGAAIFNGLSTGEGVNKTGVDTKHTGIIFGRADLLGKMDAMKEGDVEMTPETAVNVGFAYAYSDFEKTGSADPVEHTGQNLSVDANLKDNGASIHAEFFWAKDDPQDGENASPMGGYVQAGYFLTPKHWEIAGRYSIVSCDDGKAGGDCEDVDQIQEATAGLNYYFIGHNLKAQFNYVYKSTDPVGSESTENDNRIVVQMSAYL